MSEETMEIEVLRYRPEQEDLPTYEVFEVPYVKEWVVLDALNHIKDGFRRFISQICAQ